MSDQTADEPAVTRDDDTGEPEPEPAGRREHVRTTGETAVDDAIGAAEDPR
jgi:hypothetical protein